MRKSIITLAVSAALLGCVSASAETIWRKSAVAYVYTYIGIYISHEMDINLGVWPVASGHSTGAVWTPDGWNTVNWASGTWAQNVPNQYGSYDESWWIDISHVDAGGKCEDVYFWYALYVDTSDSTRYWDNNGGYNYETIAQGVCN